MTDRYDDGRESMEIHLEDVPRLSEMLISASAIPMSVTSVGVTPVPTSIRFARLIDCLSGVLAETAFVSFLLVHFLWVLYKKIGICDDVCSKILFRIVDFPAPLAPIIEVH